MSAADFHKTFYRWLQSIGFPTKIRSENLEWINGEPNLRTFLQSLAANITQGCILSLDEIIALQTLESQGKLIPKGRLQEMLKSRKELVTSKDSNHFSSPGQSLLHHQEKIKHLRQKLSQMTDAHSLLVKRREKLLQHSNSLAERKDLLRVTEQTTQSKFKITLSQLETKISDFDRSILALKEKVDKLVEETGTKSLNQSNITSYSSSLIHLQNFSPYLQEDDSFTREIKGYFQKQFHQGPSSILQNEDTNQYKWFDLKDASKYLVKGDPKEIYDSSCKELARLGNVFSIGHEQKIHAHIRMTRNHGKLLGLENVLKSTHNYGAMTERQLQSIIVDKSNLWKKLTLSNEQVFYQEIIPIIKDMQSLQMSTILSGDYDLKISRQNYHMDKQDKVIKMLIEQQARHVLFYLTIHRSHKNMQVIQQLVETVSSEFSSYHDFHQQRMIIGHQLSTSTQQHLQQQRKTIDSKDYLSSAMHTLLHGHSETNAPFIRLDSISTKAVQLGDQIRILSGNQGSVHAEFERMTSMIGQSVSTLKKLHERCEKSSDGQSPIDELKREQQKLSSSLGGFSDVLNSLIEERGNLLQDIQRWPKELRDERKLYVQFFLAPDHLRASVNELERRAAALNPSSI